FQAEDGIRDFHVTGVQTCALPISFARRRPPTSGERHGQGLGQEEGREEEAGEDAEGKARCEEGEESRPLSRLFFSSPDRRDNERSEARRTGTDSRTQKWKNAGQTT